MGDLNEYIFIQQFHTLFFKILTIELILEKHSPEGPYTARSNKINHTIDGK